MQRLSRVLRCARLHSVVLKVVACRRAHKNDSHEIHWSQWGVPLVILVTVASNSASQRDCCSAKRYLSCCYAEKRLYILYGEEDAGCCAGVSCSPSSVGTVCIEIAWCSACSILVSYSFPVVISSIALAFVCGNVSNMGLYIYKCKFGRCAP